MNTNENLPFYECQYCGKKLLKKATFDKHECAKMVKLKSCKTKKGLAAFNDYKLWMTIKGQHVPRFETFVDSRFYNSFMGFQDFVSSKGIPDRKMFISYMVSLQMSPMFWTSNANIYENFIAYYDATKTPMEMVNVTLATMHKLSDIFECDIGDVLENLLPSEIAKLVFERRLSPWLLLLSKKFNHYLHMLEDPSQYIMITNVIDVDEWHKKFKKNPEAVAAIKSIIFELHI